MSCSLKGIFRQVITGFLAVGCVLFGRYGNAKAQYRPPLTKQSNWSVSNKVTQVNGADFLPIGIYYVSFYRDQDPQRLIDLEKIASNGFNMVATPIDSDDKPVLDKAAQLGLYTMIEFNSDPPSVISMAKGHPTRSWFLAFDDVDELKADGNRYFTVNQVATETPKLKAKIPGALTLITAFSTARSREYMGFGDTYCYQVYPIPYEPVSAVTYNMKIHLASDAIYRNQVPLGCIQSYRNPNQRMPTKAEFRNMTYQALALGVKGLMYYTFFDDTTNLNKYPGLWAEMGRVNREVESLKGFYLRGRRTVLSTGNSQVYASQFTWKGRTIVVVINGFGSNSYPITLQPTIRATSARNVFSSRRGTLTLQNGALVGTLGAKTVSVYELTTSTVSKSKSAMTTISKKKLTAAEIARSERLARARALAYKRSRYQLFSGKEQATVP